MHTCNLLLLDSIVLANIISHKLYYTRTYIFFYYYQLIVVNFLGKSRVDVLLVTMDHNGKLTLS